MSRPPNPKRLQLNTDWESWCRKSKHNHKSVPERSHCRAMYFKTLTMEETRKLYNEGPLTKEEIKNIQLRVEQKHKQLEIELKKKEEEQQKIYKQKEIERITNSIYSEALVSLKTNTNETNYIYKLPYVFSDYGLFCYNNNKIIISHLKKYFPDSNIHYRLFNRNNQRVKSQYSGIPCSKSTNWGLNGHVININHTNLQNHKEWIKKGRHCCCNGARSDCKWFQYIIIDWE